MENWLGLYSSVKSSDLLKFEKKKGALIGFNVNIDKIIQINPTIIDEILSSEVIDRVNLIQEPPSNVETIYNFFNNLFYTIKNQRADEVLINSQNLANWIEDTFTIKEVKIGGQAGIIANLYRKLGLEKVLLSLPIFDTDLMNLLEPNILTILKKDSRYSIEKISNIKGQKEKSITHYVFEFTKGIYTIGNYKLDCKRANRLIFSHDEVNTQLAINEGFMNYCEMFLPDYSLAIISGFHLLSQRINTSTSFYDLIKPIEVMIRKWKAINPHLCIHLEIASTKNSSLRKTIIDTLFPIVDSIGLNEQELMSFIEIIEPKLASELERSVTSITVFQALNKIFSLYSNLRIHFHYLGYYLILSSSIEQEIAEIRKTGLILSSLFAALKANGVLISSLKDIEKASLDLSTTGFEQIKQLQAHLDDKYLMKSEFYRTGIIHTDKFSLVGIPTIVVKDPYVIVGLGDLISSISLFYETR